MGKDKKQTTTVDDTTAGRQQQVWDSANATAAHGLAPVNGAVNQALGGFQNTAAAGNLGLGALSGNQADYAKLSNPYQQNVIDQINNQYGRGAAHITNSVNAAAGAAGAFGGDRAAVAQGEGLSDLANQQALQVAGITNQGYNNTMNRAGQLANLGMGANGAVGNIGQYLTGQAQQAGSFGTNTLEQAQRGMATGTTQTQKGSLLGDVLGVGSTIAGLIPGFGGGGSGAAASTAGNAAINQSPYLQNLNTGAPQIPGSIGYGNGMGG